VRGESMLNNDLIATMCKYGQEKEKTFGFILSALFVLILSGLFDA
jgi:hypothetical protein